MGTMQDMVNNNEKCRIEKEGDGFHVLLNPDSVTKALNDKLLPEDIQQGMNIVNNVLNLSSINNSLHRQCIDINCVNKCTSPFKSIPNGNPNARIMLLNKMPTDYESCRMCSHCDTASIFLSLVLSRINISRNDVYCTDMIKCNCNTLDEQSFRSCIESYLLKEVQYVHPEIIICDGIAVLKSWAKLGYIDGLPQDIQYGNIYDVIISGISLKIMAIFDIDRVIQKQGEDLIECKGKLWLQIIKAINAIGG